MFPDSAIAKKFGCARTKTRQILNDAIMPALLKHLVDYVKTQLFSLTNDGTSDTGIKKVNATCALIFDVRTSKEVQMKFYNMCPTTSENTSTAKSLFQSVDGAMKKDKLNSSKCVSFGADNCNTNMRCNNSMQTRILNENKSCFIAGCSCPLAHLTAKAGGRAFQKVSNFDAEDHQVDLYYYFKGSTYRKSILIEYLQFVGLEWEEMS